MNDKIKDYYVSIKQVAKLDEIKPEFEIWLNASYDFVLLWENVFNDEKFNFKHGDFITFEEWAVNESISIIKNEDDYFIHPHILLAFSIEDPTIKINLLSAVFSLPDNLISDFLMKVFGQNKTEETKTI